MTQAQWNKIENGWFGLIEEAPQFLFERVYHFEDGDYRVTVETMVEAENFDRAMSEIEIKTVADFAKFHLDYFPN